MTRYSGARIAAGHRPRSRRRGRPGPGCGPSARNRRGPAGLGLVGVDREACRRTGRPGGPRDRCSRRASGRSSGRRRRRPAATARRSSGAAPTAAPRPGTARRRPACPPRESACSGTGTPLQVTTWRPGDRAAHGDLHPLDRGVDVARGARAGDLLAEHVPRLDRAAAARACTPADLDRAEPREAELEERLEPGRRRRRGRGRRRSATTSAMSAATNAGSRNRSCSSVPQRTSGPEYGSSQNRATSARTSSAWTSAICGCGGISKPRSSSSPSRPRSESGLNSLSMQNSARWVLPVMSVSRWRSARSTCHGRASSAEPWPARRTRSPARRASRAGPRRPAAPGWSGR